MGPHFDHQGVVVCRKRAHAVRRMALVQVLFESHPGPAIPESDPELRAVLLDSLKTYEREEAQRPAFGKQPHIPVPEAASSTSMRLLNCRLLGLTIEVLIQSSLQVFSANACCVSNIQRGSDHGGIASLADRDADVPVTASDSQTEVSQAVCLGHLNGANS